jgi:hypothetical protein
MLAELRGIGRVLVKEIEETEKIKEVLWDIRHHRRLTDTAVAEFWSVTSEMLAELRGIGRTLAKETEEPKGIP